MINYIAYYLNAKYGKVVRSIFEATYYLNLLILRTNKELKDSQGLKGSDQIYQVLLLKSAKYLEKYNKLKINLPDKWTNLKDMNILFKKMNEELYQIYKMDW